MSYIISPVQAALRDTSDILGRGLREAGESAIRKEELGLKRDLTKAQLERQAELDAMQRPGLRLKQEQDRMSLDQLNQPISVSTIFPDVLAMQHASYLPEGEPKSLAEKIGDVFGAKVDVDQKSKTYGKYVKSDGSVLTNRDFMVRGKEVADLILANTNPVHTVSDQITRYTEKLAGLPQGSPQAAQTLKNLEQAKMWLEDPNMQLQTLQKQRSYLAKLTGPEFEKGVARIDAQIDSIKKQVAEAVKTEKEQAWKAGEEQKKRAWDREKLAREQAGKKEIAEINAQAKRDAADRIAAKKGQQYSAAEKANLDLMKNEYNSNLRIIEEYRKGGGGDGFEPAVTAHQASEALKRNQKILKDIEKRYGLKKEDLAQEQNLDPLGLFEKDEDEE